MDWLQDSFKQENFESISKWTRDSLNLNFQTSFNLIGN